MYSIQQIKAANETAGHHFFERGAMRFFRSRVCRKVHHVGGGGAFFVTSEQFSASSVRRYSVRGVDASGKVDTVGDFQRFATARQAHAECKRLAAMCNEILPAVWSAKGACHA